MSEEFCICEEGCAGRNICFAWSSDRQWCSVCKKDIQREPDTEKEKQARKKFLTDCHSIDDIIVKSLSLKSEWQKYKESNSLAEEAVTGA